VIFVEAPQGVDEIELIAKEVSTPLLINLVIGGLTPLESTSRLRDLGYAIAIHPSLPLGVAAYAMLTSLAELAGRDPAPLLPNKPADFFNLVGLAEWSELGERYSVEGT
jgi:2-methylisocitrate lyase-like PEP mutase family enzyme